MNSCIVSLANTKGGVGKSTLSGNLAWALSISPKPSKVLLIDADHQASVTRWFDLGGENVPFDRLQLTTARLLQQQAPKFRKQYEWIVIDCPPMQSDITASALMLSDLGLVPVQASPLDIMAYGDLLPLLRQAQGFNEALKLYFVINQLSARTALAREVAESLAKADIPLIGTQVHDRQVYRQVVAKGSSVMEEKGPARAEILALAKDVQDALGK